MIQIKSISARLVIAISAVAAGTAAVLGVMAMTLQERSTDLALQREMKVQYDSIIAAIEYEGRTVAAVESVVAALPPVQDALQRDDRDALGALLGPALKQAEAKGIGIWTFTKPPSVVLYRVHDPKSFGDDVSSRRAMIPLVHKDHKPETGIEPGRGVLNIFGTGPVYNGDQYVGAFDVGTTIGKDFIGRLKGRYGVDLAVHRREDGKFNTLATSLGEKTLATPEEMAAALNGTPVLRRTEADGHQVAVYLGQMKNFAGEPVAVVELVRDISSFAAEEIKTIQWLAGTIGAVLLAAVGVALFVGRGMSKPIHLLCESMDELSKGHTDTEIPGRHRGDEVGQMAEAVSVFKNSMIETDRLRASQEAARRDAEVERQDLMKKLADDFEASVQSVMESVLASANEMRTTAQSMSQAAEKTQSQSLAVSSASEQTSANVQTVATAAEELSASIREISRQTATASQLASETAEDGRNANTTVSGLASAASRIGEVVDIIKSIAGQTNMLALNATIEAARAGESGKGFAVVASEVKSLAHQTEKATDEISSQVNAIQAETGKVVEAIQRIAVRVNEIAGINTSVSGAVEEQGAATNEIARNVQQAAQGSQDVTHTIGSVREAANHTGDAATRVLASAEAVATQSSHLQTEANRFLASIRTT